MLAVYGVPLNLKGKMIHGTAFMDKESKQIQTNSQQVVANGGPAVAIVKNFDGEATKQSLSDARMQDY